MTPDRTWGEIAECPRHGHHAGATCPRCAALMARAGAELAGLPPSPCPTPSDGDVAFAGAEKQLQAACEKWLQAQGFYPRSPKFLDNISPSVMGWYIHLGRCEGNPLILDLLILRRDGRYLEVELKTDKGRLAKHQSALVENSPGTTRVVRSYESFVSVVQDWIDALPF